MKKTTCPVAGESWDSIIAIFLNLDVGFKYILPLYHNISFHHLNFEPLFGSLIKVHLFGSLAYSLRISSNHSGITIEIAYVWTSSFLDSASTARFSFPLLCNISKSKVAIFSIHLCCYVDNAFVEGDIEDCYGMFLWVFFSLEGTVTILLIQV